MVVVVVNPLPREFIWQMEIYFYGEVPSITYYMIGSVRPVLTEHILSWSQGQRQYNCEPLNPNQRQSQWEGAMVDNTYNITMVKF